MSRPSKHNVGNLDIEIVPAGPGYDAFVRIIRSDYAWHAVSVDAAEIAGLIGILSGADKLFTAEAVESTT